MTVKELKRIIKKMADDTEILVGTAAILRVERKFTFDGKMQLILILK
ncbi:MAG: hypothetical protein ABIJ57_02195 [Pseudomonadota bacterium]